MRLWRCELPCLGGFYASAVIVVATDDREQAAARVCEAVRSWIRGRAEEYGSLPNVDAMAWEDEWDAEVEKLMRQVEAEASANVKLIESGEIVNVRS